MTADPCFPTDGTEVESEGAEEDVLEGTAASWAATEGSAPADVISLRIPVPPMCDGWRLDHFLKWRIDRLSRTKVQAIIDTQIRFADGRKARPSARVRSGELVHLERPAPIEPEVPRYFDVLAEDEHFIAIDKPAGLPMHTTAKFWRNTLTALLRERYPDEPIQLCHRIDRETSGVLLLARHARAASSLKKAFANRRVKKSYLALVHGRVEADLGLIDAPLGLLDTPTHLMMGVVNEGLEARTRFHVRERFRHHTFVGAEPETGRQHQIRVHFAHLGHPLVGDKLYRAGEKAFMAYCDGGMTDELLALFDGLPRQALHAHRLSFPHPAAGELVTVESPIPADLTAYMQTL